MMPGRPSASGPSPRQALIQGGTALTQARGPLPPAARSQNAAEVPEAVARLDEQDVRAVVQYHLDMREAWARVRESNGIPEARVPDPPAPYQDPGRKSTVRPPFERSPSDRMESTIVSAKRTLLCDAIHMIAGLDAQRGTVPARLVDAARIPLEKRTADLEYAFMWAYCDVVTTCPERDAPLGLEPSARALALNCARIFLGIPELGIGYRAGKDGICLHLIDYSPAVDPGHWELDDERLGLGELRRSDQSIAEKLDALPEEDLDDVRVALAHLLHLRITSLYVSRLAEEARVAGPPVEAGPEEEASRSAGVMLLLRDVLSSYVRGRPLMGVEPHRARDWILGASRRAGEGLAGLGIPSRKYDPGRGAFL